MDTLRHSWKVSRSQHFLLHIAFVLILFVVVAPQYPSGRLLPFLFYKSISLLLILSPVYINLYLLFPLYQNRSKWLYAGMLFLLTLLFTLLSYGRFLLIDPAYVPAYVHHDYPKISMLFLFISLVMIMGTAMLIKLIRLFQEQKEKVHQLRQHHLESELQFLKLQISPHFYFNIMNSIYHSIKIDPEQAERIVLQLSDIMKYHIYDCHKETVELEHELKNIHNYIGLQKMRLAKEPRIDIDVEGDLSNQLIAPLILITFVENAFKHGLENQSRQQSLVIRLKVSGNVMQFHISNSKPNLLAGSKSVDGAGLINVKKRLELLYPSLHELHIDDQNDLYTVNLKIQLR